MAPSTITCVRHAQGFHNLTVANHAIHDPLLTPMGEEQCRILAQNFPKAHMDQIELIIASPLKRTIYTALLSFAPVIKQKNLKVLLLPELQETSDLPCDTGSSLEEIRKEFAGQPIDTSIMEMSQNADWTSKTGRWAPNSSAIEERAKVAREFLYSRDEKEVAVVTHGGFLHYFTQDWSDISRLDGTPSAGTGWANTEYRHYIVTTPNGEVQLVETPESRKKRLPDVKPLSKEEQKNLQRATQAQWAEQERQEKEYYRVNSIQAKV
ncbi:hypothetical protein AAFC00_004315 [Neodothiora populina]|uniref:Phosphoglycerate mutase-like protein n=1 Tax=Neodothiora populina TaxID=2781224 RepID=A0ABR3PJC0_9PEZI